MIDDCPHCRQDHTGRHEWHCPTMGSQTVSSSDYHAVCAGCVERDQRIAALQSTIAELREELAQRSGMSIMALYHEGITLRDALVSSQATIAELREELAQWQNAASVAH